MYGRGGEIHKDLIRLNSEADIVYKLRVKLDSLGYKTDQEVRMLNPFTTISGNRSVRAQSARFDLLVNNQLVIEVKKNAFGNK